MPAELQYISIVFAFLITVIVIYTTQRRANGNGGKTAYYDQVQVLNAQLKLLQERNEFYDKLLRLRIGAQRDNSAVRDLLYERYNSIHKQLAILGYQIDAQGGRSRAPASLLLQYDDLQDELKMIESQLDQEDQDGSDSAI